MLRWVQWEGHRMWNRILDRGLSLDRELLSTGIPEADIYCSTGHGLIAVHSWSDSQWAHQPLPLDRDEFLHQHHLFRHILFSSEVKPEYRNFSSIRKYTQSFFYCKINVRVLTQSSWIKLSDPSIIWPIYSAYILCKKWERHTFWNVLWAILVDPEASSKSRWNF